MSLLIRIKGKEYKIEENCTLGRASPFLELKDNSNVSRQHLQVLFEDERVLVKDLSSNGSWVNSKKLEHNDVIEIKPGDQLRLGDEIVDVMNIDHPKVDESSDFRVEVPTQEFSVLLSLKYIFLYILFGTLISLFITFVMMLAGVKDRTVLAGLNITALFLVGMNCFKRYKSETGAKKSNIQKTDGVIKKQSFDFNDVSKVFQNKFFAKNMIIKFKDGSKLLVDQKDLIDKVLDQKKKYGYQVVNYDLYIVGILASTFLALNKSSAIMVYLNLPTVYFWIIFDLIFFLLALGFIFSFYFKGKDFGMVPINIKNKTGGKKQVLTFALIFLCISGVKFFSYVEPYMTSRECTKEGLISENCSSFFSEVYAHGFMTKNKAVEKYERNCEKTDNELCLNFISNVVSHHDEELAFIKMSSYCSRGERFSKEKCRFLLKRTTKPLRERLIKIVNGVKR